MPSNFAYMSNDIEFTRMNGVLEQWNVYPLYTYDLPYASIENYDGLIISNFVDEEFLLEHRLVIERYLQQGGVVCSFAEAFLPWLPCRETWMRSNIPLRIREMVMIEPRHSIFKGVDPYDLNYRKGVKGFFSRGYMEPNRPVHPVITDEEGHYVAYIDTESSKGTMYISAGGDPFMIFRQSGNSTERIILQLIEWMTAEAMKNKGVVTNEDSDLT
ncbi:aspartate/tyrosine/aromatic aminotransferase [Bacillaceae bacterium SAS-127]|nr:aspartate/tyrosine/aromatic aminotransferase [Bacillaceae bacterium SAS-127]